MTLSPYIARIRAQIGDDLLLIPTVAGIVRRDGAILLVQHGDAGQWVIPGGMVEPDERPRDALIREMREETSLDVEPLRVLDTFGGPGFTWTYANGHQVAFVMSAFECAARGEPEPDGVETTAVRWVARAEWLDLKRPAWMDVVMPSLFG